MPGSRTRMIAVATFAVGAVLGPAVSVAREASPIAGLVRDALGRAVAGAEVLISAGGPSPVAVLRSDAHGRVFLAELPGGEYRVAVIKDGYRTIVETLDARATAWIDLILEPAVGIDPAELPDDAWALRLPRRYMLREVDHAPLDVAIDAERTLELADVEAPIDVQVDHLVALHAGTGERDGKQDLGGTETAVRVRSGLGTRGGIEVAGFRRAVQASRDAREDPASVENDATGVRVGFSYATEPDSDLAVSAFWGRSGIGYATGLESIAAPSPDLTRAQRSWGYGASWSKPLDGESRLDLSMDFRDTSVSHPATGNAGASAEPATGGRELSSRAVAAAGTYLTQLPGAHELQVQFGARLLDAAAALRVAPSATAAELRGLPGLSLGIEASDRWTVAGPTSVIWGLGYRHTIEPVDVALIVPRVGGAWRLDGTDVSALLSYHGVSGATTTEPLSSSRAFRGAGEVGYELSVAVPIGSGLRIAGATSATPSQIGLETTSPGAVGIGSRMFVSDGDVAVREHRIALSRVEGPLRGTIDVTSGTARGTLDLVLPLDAPVYELADRHLRYVSGAVGFRAVSSGTSVTVSYRNVTQTTPSYGSSGAEDVRLEAIELALAQDLFYLRALGSWRALAAFRAADVVSSLADDDVRMADTTGHQVSAGVSVLF